MVTPASWREAVAHTCDEHGVRQRRACAVLNIVPFAVASTGSDHQMECGLQQDDTALINGNIALSEFALKMVMQKLAALGQKQTNEFSK